MSEINIAVSAEFMREMKDVYLSYYNYLFNAK